MPKLNVGYYKILRSGTIKIGETTAATAGGFWSERFALRTLSGKKIFSNLHYYQCKIMAMASEGYPKGD